MPEFRDFLWAVASNWVALMSGLVSVLVAAYLRLKKKSDIASTGFWIVAAMCLYLGCFLAWRDEHRSKVSALSSLSELTTPRLQCHIDQVDIASGRWFKHRTLLLLWASITNLGSDSTADSYTLTATTTDGTEIQFDPILLPPRMNFTDIGFSLETGQSALYDKTAEQPIPKGGARKGILAFVTDRSAPDSLRKHGVTLVMSVNDVLGKTSRASYAMKGVSEGFKYIPGTPKPQNIK